MKTKTAKINLNHVVVSILMIIMLVLVSGIEGCQSKEKETVIPGISMEFVDNAPPTTITTGQKVPIYVDVKNGGGVHIGIGNAMFFLSGVGENLDGVTEKTSNSRFLDKKTGAERLRLATSASSLLDLEKPFMFPLTLTACYGYGTIAQIEACIPRKDGTSDVCSIEGEKITDTSNSAAPVQITSFTEKVEGNKLTITFIIENRGVNKDKIGEIYSDDASCGLINKKDINEGLKRGIVDTEVVVGKGDDEFICSLQDNTASISTTGKGKVECVKTLSDEDYMTMFRINLKYRYVDSIGTIITLLPA